MRKFLAIVLALMLALSMATIAFAATATETANATIEANKDNPLTEDNNSADAEVKVKLINDKLPDNPQDVDPDDEENVVYAVDIDAKGAVFTYTFDANYNTTTHQYEDGSWDKLSDVIKVTNHSNTSIDITAVWKENGVTGVEVDATAKTAKLNNVTATLSNTEFDLASAVNAAENAAPTANIGVAISDTIPTVFSDEFALNYVTITIAGK